MTTSYSDISGTQVPSRKVVSGDTPTEPPGVSVYTVTVNFTLQQDLNHLQQQGQSSRVHTHDLAPVWKRGSVSSFPMWVLYPPNHLNSSPPPYLSQAFSATWCE
ncbi:hypothetical protein STEG23_034453, partial [Scotinomys teguina]